jgi:hypothetical protein
VSDLDTLIAEHERLCAAIVAHGRALVALRPEAHAATANYVNDARIGLWRALCVASPEYEARCEAELAARMAADREERERAATRGAP